MTNGLDCAGKNKNHLIITARSIVLFQTIVNPAARRTTGPANGSTAWWWTRWRRRAAATGPATGRVGSAGRRAANRWPSRPSWRCWRPSRRAGRPVVRRTRWPASCRWRWPCRRRCSCSCGSGARTEHVIAGARRPREHVHRGTAEVGKSPFPRAIRTTSAPVTLLTRKHKKHDFFFTLLSVFFFFFFFC